MLAVDLVLGRSWQLPFDDLGVMQRQQIMRSVLVVTRGNGQKRQGPE
jgi:hypothetical protein